MKKKKEREKKKRKKKKRRNTVPNSLAQKCNLCLRAKKNKQTTTKNSFLFDVQNP